MKKLFALLACVFAFLIIFPGCGEDVTSRLEVYYSMNAEADLVISDRFDSKRNKYYWRLKEYVYTLLNEVDLSISLGIPTSYINKFNAAEAGETVELDKICYEVLTVAKEMYTLTDGYYNPAVYYSVQSYGFNEAADNDKSPAERIPDDGIIEKYRVLSTRFGELELSEDNGKYFAKKPDATFEDGGVTYSLKLDLGGIGKGYAVDKVNSQIDRLGFKYGYFNFGASSMVCKEHYENGEYIFGFTNPRTDSEGSIFMTSSGANVCRSTSGDYAQYFEHGGKRYCHVFDPTTGKPIQTGIMSASVIGGTAGEGDALTTAIMAMGKERAVKFINEKLYDRRVTFTFDNNGSYEIITNIPESEYTVTHSKFKVVNTLADGKIVLGGGNVS